MKEIMTESSYFMFADTLQIDRSWFYDPLSNWYQGLLLYRLRSYYIW